MHFIPRGSLVTRMFCWFKDAGLAAGLLQNHSDRIVFGLTDGKRLGIVCCSEKPLGPVVVCAGQ